MGNENSKTNKKKENPDIIILNKTFNEYANLCENSLKLINEENFVQRVFAKIPEFGKKLFDKNIGSHNSIDLSTFIKLAKTFSNPQLSSDYHQQLKFYLKFFSADNLNLSINDFCSFLSCCKKASFLIAQSPIQGNQKEEDPIILSFINTLFEENGQKEKLHQPVSIETASAYLNQFATACCLDLHDHVIYRLFKKINLKKVNQASSLNHIQKQSSLLNLCCDGNSLLGIGGLWLMSYSSPFSFLPTSEIGTSCYLGRCLEGNGWHLLYGSKDQGLSANRFVSKVLGYPAYTLSFFRFGGFLLVLGFDQQWKESHLRRGSYDSFLLQLLPTFRLLIGGKENINYFNLNNRTVKKALQCFKDSLLVMEINSDFSNVIFSPLHSSSSYALDAVEVWGCGGHGNYMKYLGQKQWEEKDTFKHQNRKLKPDDWKDNPDKMLLSYGGIETDHSKRGDL